MRITYKPRFSILNDLIGLVLGLPLSVFHINMPFFFSLNPALGAAYGTAKSGTGIAAMSVMRPDLIMKSVIPVVMAGIIAIYGLVVSVLVANKRESLFFVFMHRSYQVSAMRNFVGCCIASRLLRICVCSTWIGIL